MNEQVANHYPPIRRRASIAAQPTANRGRGGHNAGIHPEDDPRTTQSRYVQRTPSHSYVDYDEVDTEQPPSMPRSAIRYQTIQQPTAVQEEPKPRRRYHPLLWVGIVFLLILVGVTLATYVPPAIQNWRDTMAYGFPRTTQLYANVGHGGVSHFIGLNDEGKIEVIELPANPQKQKPSLIVIAAFTGPNASQYPVTLQLVDLNRNGKPDIIVISNSIEYMLYNNGSTFTTTR